MATELQADVAMVLDDLKFESVPGGMPGSLAKFKVAEDTVRFLQSLFEDSKVISVGSDGTITIE